jgi:hypothetical protein
MTNVYEFQEKVYKKAKIKPIGFMKGYRTSKTPAGMKSTEFPVYPMPRQEVIYKPKTNQLIVNQMFDSFLQ